MPVMSLVFKLAYMECSIKFEACMSYLAAHFRARVLWADGMRL
jgi:hypothetical protein